MGSKSNKILVCLILLLVGVLYLIQQYLNISSIIFLAVGVALLLLYKNKHVVWALIPSIYLLYLFVVEMLSKMGLNTGIIIAAMFFIVPGIIFFICFVDKKRNLFITPACSFLFLGVYILISELTSISRLNLFLCCMGISFILEYILSKGKFKKTRLYLGIIFSCISILSLIFKFLPVLFIGVVLLIILKCIDDKTSKN